MKSKLHFFVFKQKSLSLSSFGFQLNFINSQGIEESFNIIALDGKSLSYTLLFKNLL